MLKYWLWLANLPGLTNQTRLALLHHFVSPEAAFYADQEEVLLTEGITRQQAELLNNHDLQTAEQILADCAEHQLSIVTIADGAYPSRLKNIYDPPTLLYVRGRLPAVDEEAAVAVVGTRDCTPYGIACAEKFGYGLASCGAMVVSGMALGIDGAAAKSALRAGGTVLGVVANGLDIVYPREHWELYEDVAAAGALLSEYPPGTRPVGSHFPVRNRILSGLSVATLVVEAPRHSGALITAGTALEQGRDVFAVPGPIDAENSVGCNRLLQEGAGLVCTAWDILREYEPQFPDKLHCEERAPTVVPATAGYQARRRAEETRKQQPAPASLSLSDPNNGLTDDQIALLRALDSDTPSLVDDLSEQTDIPVRRVLSALTLLEIDHLVSRHDGKRYTRAVTLCE